MNENAKALARVADKVGVLLSFDRFTSGETMCDFPPTAHVTVRSVCGEKCVVVKSSPVDNWVAEAALFAIASVSLGGVNESDDDANVTLAKVYGRELELSSEFPVDVAEFIKDYVAGLK